MCGRQWLMAWEDGQRGIYRMDATQSINIGKNHDIMDSSEPALVENLMSDTQQHYIDQLISPLSSMPVTEPSMSRV